MDSYLPIREASQKIKIAETDLNQLAKVGKIKTVIMHGEILLRESDVMSMLPKGNFEDLIGKPIGIGEAARKYNLHQPTISRWKDKGYVKVISQTGQKIFLDEADVARMAAYYATRPGKGRRTDIDFKK